MEPNTKVIMQGISSFFREEVLNCCLFVILAFVAIIASLYGFKVYVKRAMWKAVLLIVLTCFCALSLILMKTITFIPVYKDYKNMSFTIEQNAEVFIQEGMNNLLEQKNSVVLITEDGDTINLKITNDYNFDTGIFHRGTVVYMINSKHIIWYEFCN